MVDLISIICVDFWAADQVCVDCVEVERSPGYYKHVPDGVCTRNDAVALEEDDAYYVDETAESQFIEAICVIL